LAQDAPAEKPAGQKAEVHEPGEKKGQQPEPPPLPSDPRLLTLHREFIKKAEKLAAEYEHNKQTDKAATVYGEMLRLVPSYDKARARLEQIRQAEANSHRKTFEVQANQGWQDTGVRLIAGKPVRIAAGGTWTFNLSMKLGPDGIEIPKALKDFKLGSLVGVIGGPDPRKMKPFMIGKSLQLVAEESGPLLVRMYDNDPSDNQGKLSLEIVGKFEEK